jgi:hypothetical protein
MPIGHLTFGLSITLLIKWPPLQVGSMQDKFVNYIMYLGIVCHCHWVY